MDYVLNFPDQLGLHIKSLRKAAGMSQAKLASLLQVSQSRVAAIEKDPAAISVGQFLAILKLLDAELVVRKKKSEQSRLATEKMRVAQSAATTGLEKSVLKQLGSMPSPPSTVAEWAKQNAVTSGLERAQYEQLRRALSLKPQDLPADWQSKKPKGNW